MFKAKKFDAGWAVVNSETEEVALLDDCPQVCLPYDDAQSIAETLNELDEIRSRKAVH